LLLNSLGVPCPVFVERSLSLLGDFALPLALLGIGASLARSKLRGHVGVPLIATAFKLGLMVLLAYCFCQLFNVRGVQQTLVLLLAACPTAIASYVMAHELGSDAEFTSRTIVLSTVLCFPVFVLILLFS
jgi:predicted permease